MISYIVLAVALGFFLAALSLYLKATRPLSGGNEESARSQATTRQRAVLDDFGEDVIWEIGQKKVSMKPVIDSHRGKGLTRRGFLPRFALSILVFVAGKMAARAVAGISVEDLLDQPASPAGSSAKIRSRGLASGSHHDTHSDKDCSHTDTGRGQGHVDQLPCNHTDRHTDTTDRRKDIQLASHTDTHTDSPAVNHRTNQTRSHIDVNGPGAHADYPPQHMDSHADSPHGDGHTDQNTIPDGSSLA